MATTQVAIKPKRVVRTYNDADRARGLAAIHLHNGNLTRASQESGIPRDTLRTWRDAKLSAPKQSAAERLVPAALSEHKSLCAQLATAGVQRAVETVRQASAKDAAWIGAVYTDKWMTLEGMPTVIHGRATATLDSLTPDQLHAALTAYRAALARPVEVVPSDTPLSLTSGSATPATDTPVSPPPAIE